MEQKSNLHPRDDATTGFTTAGTRASGAAPVGGGNIETAGRVNQPGMTGHTGGTTGFTGHQNEPLLQQTAGGTYEQGATHPAYGQGHHTGTTGGAGVGPMGENLGGAAPGQGTHGTGPYTGRSPHDVSATSDVDPRHASRAGGMMEKLKGSVQEGAGKLTGNQNLKARGAEHKVQGETEAEMAKRK
ncbi:uncharacterized protein VTP21DRAFT_8590 [Calcarisporiella thermophila]|uniref:uncharacterized protein n=1 Tax=Calcarisporiella thermophila TaxID=911321 RepID=UPI00374347DC